MARVPRLVTHVTHTRAERRDQTRLASDKSRLACGQRITDPRALCGHLDAGLRPHVRTDSRLTPQRESAPSSTCHIRGTARAPTVPRHVLATWRRIARRLNSHAHRHAPRRATAPKGRGDGSSRTFAVSIRVRVPLTLLGSRTRLNSPSPRPEDPTQAGRQDMPQPVSAQAASAKEGLAYTSSQSRVVSIRLRFAIGSSTRAATSPPASARH